MGDRGAEGRPNGGFVYRRRVASEDDGRTVVEHLSRRYPHSDRGLWAARLGRGEVSVEGRGVTADHVVHTGDLVAWSRPPWVEETVPLDFSLLYEDRDLVAVGKPGGLPTAPAGGFLDHTLVTRVRRRWPEASPLHRLGRGTSGVVLFGRTRAARSALSADWRRGRVLRLYRALIRGRPARSVISIDVPIDRVAHPTLGAVWAARPGDGAYASHTVVRVLRDEEAASVAEVVIHSGRPHQIRIHLAAAGHPLVGDPLWGAGGQPIDGSAALPGDVGYLLHASELGFTHPSTGEWTRVSCPPPRPLRLNSELQEAPSCHAST